MTLPRFRSFSRFLIEFARIQALCCLFPFAIIIVLALSRKFATPGLPRYDLILLCCIGIQLWMVASRLETLDELKVICVFHVLGLALELYKTRMGSWAYPEAAWTKFGGVPLYSGFMYASVASYMCQAWRRLDLEMTEWPPANSPGVVAVSTYLNFFTHHILPDLRFGLALLISLVFRRTGVRYAVGARVCSMPLVVTFVFIGFFIWVSENLATRLGAWQYPHQALGWEPVHLQKIGSWSLLVIVSLIIVAQLKRVRSSLLNYVEGIASQGAEYESESLLRKKCDPNQELRQAEPAAQSTEGGQ